MVKSILKKDEKKILVKVWFFLLRGKSTSSMIFNHISLSGNKFLREKYRLSINVNFANLLPLRHA